jgi:hypothetical protein
MDRQYTCLLIDAQQSNVVKSLTNFSFLLGKFERLRTMRRFIEVAGSQSPLDN